MRVLSLFDGISCGQIALERAGIPVEVYYASEIDKYAIQITQKNYPNTIQLGDINNIDFTEFIGKVDLIMGGSPCQDLSIAGKRKGLSGERSGLFYKFVEAIEVIKPKYFLLENNVGMPKEAYEEISRLMGCYPVMINSALVSAQTRKRYYWSNIGPQELNLFGFPTCKIPQPEDKGILLKDVLESGCTFENKAVIIKAQYAKSADANFLRQGTYHSSGIFLKLPQNTVKPCALRNRGEGKQPEFNGNDKANALTSVQTDSMVLEPLTPFVLNKYEKFNDEHGYIPVMFNPYNESEIKEKSPTITAQASSQTKSCSVMCFEPIRLPQYEKSKGQAQRVYSVRGKSVVLNSNGGGQGGKTGLYKIDLPDGEYLIRKLTPLECERLQTLPDNYTEGISNTQRYKCIGNGWTVDVISHIFKFLPCQNAI